jgi:hypothetical protein
MDEFPVDFSACASQKLLESLTTVPWYLPDQLWKWYLRNFLQRIKISAQMKSKSEMYFSDDYSS